MKRFGSEGTQANVVPTMQTRMELYEFLGYHAYEQRSWMRCLRRTEAEDGKRKSSQSTRSFAEEML